MKLTVSVSLFESLMSVCSCVLHILKTICCKRVHNQSFFGSILVLFSINTFYFLNAKYEWRNVFANFFLLL